MDRRRPYFEGVKKDFDLYSQIMSDNGIITIHDTDKNYVDNFIELKITNLMIYQVQVSG